jgi:Bifunctional DNA primase/polymerase, N-terminal
VSPLREAALAYARRGLPVFPCKPRGKVPLIPSCHPDGDEARGVCHGECGKDGHGLWDATLDLDRVRAWWTRWPHANIGVRTGDLLDVLDLDGAKGIASMEAFASEHGFSLGEPVARTPGGGRHHFFAATGLGNAAELLEGVDWRGKGGYVVTGPSVHPNGRPYVPVPAAADRPPFVPAPLRALLEPPKPSPTPRPATFHPASTSTAYARAALEGTQARILEAARGERNAVAFREGAALFGLVAGGVVGEGEALAMLEDAMRAVGLGAREIGATIASARRRGIQRPRGIPAERSTVAIPPPGAVLSEDSFNAWANGKPQVAPSHHTLPPVVFPTARLRELYRVMDFRSYLEQGRRICAGVSHAALARFCGVSVPTVERELRTLEGLGFITREQSPNHRLPGGEIVRTGPNRYVLHLDSKAVQIATIERVTGPSRSQKNMQVRPSHQEGAVMAVNQVEALHLGTTVSREGWKPPVDGGTAAPELWPTDELGNYLPVRLHVPEADRLDHDPTAAEVLATIRGGLGEARVLGAVRHDDPATAAKLAAIHAGSAPLPDGWSWRERWHAEPAGACVRCGDEANTTGPDSRPWHPLCWSAAGTPPPHPAYRAGTRLRPRVLSLADSLEDFHRAVDHLDRDACLEGPCRPRQPCRRHTRRQRVEP